VHMLAAAEEVQQTHWELAQGLRTVQKELRKKPREQELHKELWGAGRRKQEQHQKEPQNNHSSQLGPERDQ
jgi:hypothetical protein